MVDKRTAAGVIAWIGLMACCSQSFIIPPTQPKTARRVAVVMMEAQEACLPRRDVLLQTTGAGLLVSAMLLGSLPRPAIAAESSSAVGYYSQVLAGYKELLALNGPEWSAAKEKGGDEVRRRLGYVGTKSPLFRISKAFKAIQDELLEGTGGSGADPLEFADAAQRVLDKIKDADFLAYSNNFSSYGNGGGGTDYLEESHKAIKPALEAYKELIDMLKLQY